MSKQQGYQELSTNAPDGVDYGFAARLPQAGGSYHTDKVGSSSAVGVSPTAYPAPAYAGAPVTGYPVMAPPMAGPVGMGVEDPLGRRDAKRARRQAKRMSRRANGGGRRKPKAGPKVALMLVGGPVGLLVGLARRAIRLGKEHLGKQSPAPTGHPGSSYNQETASHPKS